MYYNRKHDASNTGEFNLGATKRVQSKIDAITAIIHFLNTRKQITSPLVKFFAWEAVRLKAPQIIKELRRQSSISISEKLKATVLYTLSPLIKIYLKCKKNP